MHTMNNKPVTKERLVELFDKGATRKLEEHEIFAMRAVNDPSREKVYRELQTYVDIEWRYYDLAKHYYAEDFTYFENGLNEDLLVLTKDSELPPKLYAEYLREIDPSERLNEKITHSYITNLKKNIGKVRDEFR
jgi:hypothetical protein